MNKKPNGEHVQKMAGFSTRIGLNEPKDNLMNIADVRSLPLREKSRFLR